MKRNRDREKEKEKEMGGEGNKNWFACCFSTPRTSSSSSTIKLLFLIIPLILVSFIVFVLVPRNSTWVLISSLTSPPSDSAAAATAANNTEKFGAATHAEGSEQVLGLRSRVGTMVDVVHGGLKEAALSDEAARNLSASQPLDVEAAVTKIHEFDETKEDSLKITINGSDSSLNISIAGTPNATISLNESIALPLKQSRQVRTKLDKLEAGLQRARAAIKEAKNRSQLQDRDYVPIGPMYWDAKAFHSC